MDEISVDTFWHQGEPVNEPSDVLSCDFPPEQACDFCLENDFLTYILELEATEHTLPAKKIAKVKSHIASCVCCQQAFKHMTNIPLLTMLARSR